MLNAGLLQSTVQQAALILAGPKPRQEDIRRLQRPSNWNVAGQIARKPRALADVIEDLKRKVLEAARKQQSELTESRPSASGSAEQHALAGSSTDRAGVQDDLGAGEDHVLAELRERQRKRAIESEVEEQRPLAKPKAAKRQNKRTAGTASGSVEQPASKRKEQRLTAESFAACAAPPTELEHCEPASSSSGAQPAQQRSRRMYGRRKELKKLSTTAWIVEDAAKELKWLIDAAYLLRQIPAKKEVLIDPLIAKLYKPRCGALQMWRSGPFLGISRTWKK